MTSKTLFRAILLAILVKSAFYAGWGNAQVTMHGGKGMYRVQSAEPVNATDIFVNGTLSAFMEKTGPENLAKYYNINLNGTVGLASYLEAIINIVPYQDDLYHIFGRFGDTRIGLKYRTPLSTSFFKFGLIGFYKFPTAVWPNVPYEIFSTDKPAWSASALFTFDFIDIMPTNPIKIDLNIGYIDHNIYDRYFKAKYDQLLIGSGVKFSVRSMQLFLEYSGELFINNPEIPFKQNSMRISPGVRFMGPLRNTIDVAFDFTLTDYDSLKNTDKSFHKEYFGWKFTVGITHRFSVYKYFDKTAKLERQKQLEEMRKLEEIRKKREKANQDMERMKKILDKKKSNEK